MWQTAPATTCATPSTPTRSSASSAGARKRPSSPASARRCSGTWTTRSGAAAYRTAATSANASAPPDHATAPSRPAPPRGSDPGGEHGAERRPRQRARHHGRGLTQEFHDTGINQALAAQRHPLAGQTPAASTVPNEAHGNGHGTTSGG